MHVALWTSKCSFWTWLSFYWLVQTAVTEMLAKYAVLAQPLTQVRGTALQLPRVCWYIKKIKKVKSILNQFLFNSCGYQIYTHQYWIYLTMMHTPQAFSQTFTVIHDISWVPPDFLFTIEYFLPCCILQFPYRLIFRWMITMFKY